MSEITEKEMKSRWPLLAEGMAKEFGFAMSVVSEDPINSIIEKMVKRALAYNFAKTAQEYPQLKDWCVVTGPTKPVWRYEDCLNSSDGESCIEDCPYCDGVGRVPVEIIEGKLEYCYGWWSIAPNL